MTQEDFSIWNKRVADTENEPSSPSDLLLSSEAADLNDLEIVNSKAILIESNKKKNTGTESTTSNWRKYIGVVLLFFINLLNYMDRFTIAGVLIQVQEFFGINNAMGGLLQTVFIISYMLVAPLFGYLGDRYNRKIIMVIGISIWSGFTLLSSFVSSPDMFPVFLLLRALVGIGEASYSTIAPTLIGDFFVGPKRTQMLSVFFFAIPIGSGLGYIVGSQVAKYFGSWQWALRVTPGLGLIAIILVIFLCPNPPRGASESNREIEENSQNTYLDDLKYLKKNKTFILITIGFTFMAFVIGSLTLWGPVFFAYSEIATGAIAPCSSEACDYTEVNFLFGLITCVAGFGGIGLGAEIARRWKLSGRKNADPIVCAVGLILGAPLLLIGVHIALLSIETAWTMIFLADVSLCLTWTLVGDMTLYVTEPSRRSTANAVMILTGHLFGDAGSPYLIGVISDSLMESRPDTYLNKYFSLQQAMYVTLFASVIGGGGFLLASLVIVEDKEKVDLFIKGTSAESSRSTTRTTCSMDSKNSIALNEDVSHYHVNEETHCDDEFKHDKINGQSNINGYPRNIDANGTSHPLLEGKETVI